MRQRAWAILAVLGLPLACGCSSGPAPDPAHPKPVVAPIPTAQPSAEAPRPSPCEIAGLLAKKAAELGEQGYLSRALRAFDEAESRCPSKAPEIKPLREKVDSYGAAEPGQTPDSLLELARKATSESEARRQRERWLRALARDSGAPTRLSAPDRTVPIAFDWSPDGSRAAVLHGGELSLYDADLKQETERYFVGREALELRWLPSGHGLITGDLEKGEYRLLDLDKKKVDHVFKVAGFRAEGMQVSRDGKLLLLRSGANLQIVELATRQVFRVVLSTAQVTSVDTSPSGDALAVGLSDGSVRVLSLTGLKGKYQIAGAGDSPSVTFASDKKLVVLSTARVKSYDAATGNPIGKPLENDQCDPALIGPKRDRILWICYAMLYTQPLSGGAQSRVFTPGTEAHLYTSFSSLALSPDGALAWYSLWGEQYVVSTVTGKQVASVEVPSWFGVRFRPDGKRIGAVRVDGTSLWTSDLRRDERVLFDRRSVLSECSRVGGAGSLGLLFADVETGESGIPGPATVSLRGLSGELWRSVPLSRLMACPEPLSEGAGRVGLLTLEDFSVVGPKERGTLAVLPLPESELESAVLTPNGAAVVVWGENGIRIVDVATKTVTQEWKLPLGSGGPVVSSPSGKRALIVGYKDRRLFEVGRDRQVEMALGEGPFDFAGEDVLLEARGAEIVRHDLATGEERVIPAVEGITRLEAAPEGACAVVVGKDGAHVIDLRKATGVAAHLGGVSAQEQIVFFSSRVVGVASHEQGSVRLYQVPSGTLLGEVTRLGAKASIYRAESGNLEVFGEGASELGCARDPVIGPFEDCAVRHVETGLLVRTLAGRGCTAEDVGDVCD